MRFSRVRGASGGGSGVVLGVLEASEGILEASWGILERSWRHLRTSKRRLEVPREIQGRSGHPPGGVWGAREPRPAEDFRPLNE